MTTAPYIGQDTPEQTQAEQQAIEQYRREVEQARQQQQKGGRS